MADETAGKILDLDAFVPEDREVKIKGVIYKVKGSASVRITLKMMKDADKAQADPSSVENIEDLVTSMQAFFVTPIEKETLEDLDNAQMKQLIAFLYGQKPVKETSEKNEISQP